MTRKPLKKPVHFDKEIDTAMNPVRRVWTVIMILAVLGLSFYVYRAFEVGDAEVWFRDVLMLILIVFLVFLAAAGLVGLLILIRKIRGD